MGAVCGVVRAELHYAFIYFHVVILAGILKKVYVYAFSRCLRVIVDLVAHVQRSVYGKWPI